MLPTSGATEVTPDIEHLARYCPNGEVGNSSAIWEPAVIVNGGEKQQLAPLYALASAIDPGTPHFDLRREYFGSVVSMLPMLPRRSG